MAIFCRIIMPRSASYLFMYIVTCLQQVRLMHTQHYTIVIVEFALSLQLVKMLVRMAQGMTL